MREWRRGHSIAICLLEAAGHGRSTRRSRSGTTREGRSRRRAPVSTSRTSRSTCRRSGCGASSQDGRPLPDQQGHPRDASSPHDLIREPPFAHGPRLLPERAHLPEATPAGKSLRTFHFALSPSGYPCLARGGRGQDLALFRLDEKHRIYAEGGRGRSPSTSPRPRTGRPGNSPRTARPLSTFRGAIGCCWSAKLNVVVDESLNILSSGAIPIRSWSTHSQATPASPDESKGLLVALRQAIEEARRDAVPSRREGVQLRYRDRLYSVTIEVIPIKGMRPQAAAVSFSRRTQSPPAPNDGRGRLPAPTAHAADGEVTRLERKLEETTGTCMPSCASIGPRWSSCRPPAEASTNEELQSVNESCRRPRRDPVRQRGAGDAQPGAAGPEPRSGSERRPPKPPGAASTFPWSW